MSDLTLSADDRFSPGWLVAAAVVGVGAAGLAAWSPAVAAAVGVALIAVGLSAAALVSPRLGVLLVILAIPLDTYGRVLTDPVYVTVYQLVLILSLLGWGWRLVAGTETYRPSALDIAMGSLLFAALWSLPLSLDRGATAFAAVRLAFLWALTALFSHYLSDRKFADTAVNVFLVTIVGVSAVAIAQYLVPGLPIGNVHSQLSLQGEQLARVAAFFTDPNNLAGLLSVGVTTSAVLLVHARTMRRAVSAFAVLALSGTALVATFSRSGWVGAFVGVVVVALTAPKGRRGPLVAAGVALVLIVSLAAPSVIVDRLASVVNYGRDTSVSTRVYMYESTVRMAADNWQSGTGIGAFAKAYPEYRNPLALAYVLKPHEVPLALIAEAGVAGLIAVVLLFGSMVWIFVVDRSGPWTHLQAVALAGVVALGVQSLFQNYLYFEYLWMFAALAVASARLSHIDREVPS